MDTDAQVEELIRVIRSRNRREIAVCVILLVVFGLLATRDPFGSLKFYGHVLFLLGTLFVTGALWFVASLRGELDSHPASDIDYWSAEMLRQARLLRWVPVWYLGPFVPGTALVVWSVVLQVWSKGWVPVMTVAVALILAAVVVGIIIRANLKAASKLALEASALREAQRA
jgi:hypothetical protein